MGTIPNLKSDDNSSIVPVSVREMSDYFEDAVVRGDLGEKRVIIGCEGFFRLTVEEFCQNAIEIIKRLMLKGDRIFCYLVVMLISTIAIATPGTCHCLSVSSTNRRNSLRSHWLFIRSLLPNFTILSMSLEKHGLV
ncbi:hypothetical protein [Microcoleus sp. Pol12B5]|uniref:hypothetical protein n=1 Tax=Microcoleus sp. Pol12B5 TaxID=3055396 RepID=UPI002FD6F19C